MKYNELRKLIKTPVFSRQDLRLHGAKIFGYQLSLWQKEGYIIKLKNGLYALTEHIKNITPEEISGQLYSPSYISLEKALSIYGIIPEMVYSFTCITPKITRRFKNQLGNFIFHHIKPSLFFGYSTSKGNNFPYLLADLEKALLDYIYFNLAKLKNKEDLLEMRLNLKSLKKNIVKSKLNKYLSFYKNKKMKNICKDILGNY